MKEIKAFIQPFKLDAVKLALSSVSGLTGLTCSRVEGYGRTRGATGKAPFNGPEVRFVPYVQIEVVCLEDLAAAVVDTIQQTAHTGLSGDGKIYLSTVDDAVRISTGEHGAAAI